jgi:GT2 family glycosyltransferase
MPCADTVVGPVPAASPTVSVVIPTRHRAAYLDVALASLAAERAEVLVVVDGPDAESESIAARHGAVVVVHERPLGLNAARNTAIDATDGDLIAFVDDDVAVHPGWLAALRDAAARLTDVDCFTGPIVGRIEDHAFPMCGREGPPLTFLDLGPADVDAPHAWGANMTIRRSAFDRIGRFDAGRELYGDEQEWQDRLRASGRPRIRYVAAAGLDHRRAGDDARLRNLARAARARGRASRRFDLFRGDAPSVAAELKVLAGCLVHGPRHRCANGPVMAAHSLGRLEVALRPPPDPSAPDFLAGRSGTVGGGRGQLRAIADRALDLTSLPARARLRLAARRTPRRRVLVLAIVRDDPEHRALFAAVRAQLGRSRHDVELATTGPGSLGKFENLNALLATHPAAGHDWLAIVDDDVVLPAGFLDALIAAAERLRLTLAQPAHRRHSHAAWSVTRRHPFATARETAFVEIGPVTLIGADAFADLLPFPALRMGWGLDVHWSALADARGWRLGVVDAVPVLHAAAPAGSAYSRETAVAEAQTFLADRPYLDRDAANRTVRTHV